MTGLDFPAELSRPAAPGRIMTRAAEWRLDMQRGPELRLNCAPGEEPARLTGTLGAAAAFVTPVGGLVPWRRRFERRLCSAASRDRPHG